MTRFPKNAKELRELLRFINSLNDVQKETFYYFFNCGCDIEHAKEKALQEDTGDLQTMDCVEIGYNISLDNPLKLAS